MAKKKSKKKIKPSEMVDASNKFDKKLNRIMQEHLALINRKNKQLKVYNGIYERYRYPVVTAEHVPPHWKYNLNPISNPRLIQRIGINATFNAGAMKFHDKYLLAVRVEGWDRKSFFAIVESDNGIDGFRFWDKPILLPENEEPDINVYDMRLTQHEDGWIYGIFCTERKDPLVAPGDPTVAIASAGIARTRDLKKWERLPDLMSYAGQQRNVVLHPEFVNGKYALYTRPQDGFIEVGSGGGIGFGYVTDMKYPSVENEVIISEKTYHTIYEMKNGLGPPPIKTPEGWLHLAHGVRNTAAGLRYVLYMFMTDLKNLSKIIHQPGGYFMAPQDEERIGDVSNVLFNNGWIRDDDGRILIYYSSSDTRLHVATSTIEQLIDYCKNTPPDGFSTSKSVKAITYLIDKNADFRPGSG